MRNAFEKRRATAIRRGMGYLARMTHRNAAQEELGSGLLYCTAFMASTARDPAIRRHSRALALEAFRRWQTTQPPMAEDCDSATVMDSVNRHFAAERLGLRFPAMRRRLNAAVARFSAEEFFWFDPAAEPPPSDVPEICDCGVANARGERRCTGCRVSLALVRPIRIWCMCFTGAYCGERIGVPLGTRYAEALQWLPAMRSYPRPRARTIDEFYDAAYAVTHVVYTLNDYGRFRLDARWLPHEFDFLARHLADAVALADPDMVGEFLDTLRAFGVPDDDPCIRAAMDFVVESQNADGSWGARAGSSEYPRFHATWAALDGLREFAWRETRLSFPQLVPALRRWAR